MVALLNLYDQNSSIEDWSFKTQSCYILHGFSYFKNAEMSEKKAWKKKKQHYLVPKWAQKDSTPHQLMFQTQKKLKRLRKKMTMHGLYINNWG